MEAAQQTERRMAPAEDGNAGGTEANADSAGYALTLGYVRLSEGTSAATYKL